MKKKHGSAHVDQHGLQGIVTVSYKTYRDTYRNTYQISRYAWLVDKKCIVTPLVSEHICPLSVDIALYGGYLLQKSPSSEASPQSLSVSHTNFLCIHNVLLHLNCFVLHVFSAESK